MNAVVAGLMALFATSLLPGCFILPPLTVVDDDTSATGDDDASSTGDDDASQGDDDTTGVGDDDSTEQGDDDTTSAGDDDTTVGDDDTTSAGDDDSSQPGKPPVIDLLQLPESAVEAGLLNFAAAASDPDSVAPLSYAWDFGDGFALDGEGMSEVTHTYKDDDAYLLCLEVTDDSGLTADRCETLVVENLPPLLSSTAPTYATEGNLYSYQIQADDPAGTADPLEYALLDHPDGMTITATGLIEWTPSRSQALAGTANFTVRISDDEKGAIDQSPVVTVFVAESDSDQDGSPASLDCDDSDASRYPGALEACNGLDDNCDGQSDEGLPVQTYYLDSDSDGYGNPTKSVSACTVPTGYVAATGDCKDTNSAIHPDQSETCNTLDDNCDGRIDEGVQTTYYQDSDGDGYGNPASTRGGCSAPYSYVSNNLDCDDTSVTVSPAAAELCNGKDDDCDAQIDENLAGSLHNGMLCVPAGSFRMGSESTASSTDERPVHNVLLNTFEIDATEVTYAKFVAFLNAQGNLAAEGGKRIDLDFAYIQGSPGNYSVADGYDSNPVSFVTWYGARDYCSWVGSLRLPTEAEWEKAARGGCELGGDPTLCDAGSDERTYPWGEAAPSCSLAAYSGCINDSKPVGSFPTGASIYGVLDMAGNVWEWTQDWYSSTYYVSSPSSNPTGPSTGTTRVLRGGSFLYTYPSIRTTKRFSRGSSSAEEDVGFRCAR